MGVSIYPCFAFVDISNLHRRWACLGIKLADLARTQHFPNASLAAIVTAQYIEATVRKNLSKGLERHFDYDSILACYNIGDLRFHWLRCLVVHQGSDGAWSISFCQYLWLYLSR
jgi:hypothetical protein